MQGHKLVYLLPTMGLASRGSARDVSISHLISAMHSVPLPSSCTQTLSNLVDPIYVCFAVCQITVPILEKELSTLTIPDISGSASTPVGSIDYELKK